MAGNIDVEMSPPPFNQLRTSLFRLSFDWHYDVDCPKRFGFSASLIHRPFQVLVKNCSFDISITDNDAIKCKLGEKVSRRKKRR